MADLVPERVQEERAWLGFSRARLAAAADLTAQDVADIEDRVRPATQQELEQLAAGLGLESPARLRNAPIPNAGQPVCILASGPIGHEDRAVIARFAEYLRYSARRLRGPSGANDQ
jgi:hypothetical protein